MYRAFSFFLICGAATCASRARSASRFTAIAACWGNAERRCQCGLLTLE